MPRDGFWVVVYAGLVGSSRMLTSIPIAAAPCVTIGVIAAHGP